MGNNDNKEESKAAYRESDTLIVSTMAGNAAGEKEGT
jgi:hypothetical protein